jgi:hypothetical protein
MADSKEKRAMPIEPNKLYVFKKSGNQVRAIAPADPHMG